MVHSVNIWYDIVTCRENFESSKAKRCILTHFVTHTQQLLGGGGGARCMLPRSASESRVNVGLYPLQAFLHIISQFYDERELKKGKLK